MSGITLKYWNGRGLMEVPRLMFALAGKAYTDVRIGDAAPCTPYSEIGDLSANLGRVPLCVSSEGSIGQSAAINFYVASTLGLMGNGHFQAAQILSMVRRTFLLFV